MADIAIRRRERERAPAPFGRELDRVLREFLRWDPFREMAPFWGARRDEGFSPDVDIKETHDAFVFKCDLPGVSEADLEVNVTGHQLTIAGKREEAEEETEAGTYYACERTLGSFQRTFTLPTGADAEHVRAELNEGVLRLIVPKAPGAVAKRIAIGAGKSAKH
jgi:HSP20 family protein